MNYLQITQQQTSLYQSLIFIHYKEYLEVVDTFSEEVVNVEFSEEVLGMIQDAIYDYAVEEHNSYYGDE